MTLHLILASIALMGVIFTGGLLLAVVGIQRGDHGKRLTGQPNGHAEAFARRLLVGSLGHAPTANGEDDES